MKTKLIRNIKDIYDESLSKEKMSLGDRGSQIMLYYVFFLHRVVNRACQCQIKIISSCEDHKCVV